MEVFQSLQNLRVGETKSFEAKSKIVFSDIKNSFDFVQTNFSSVYVYSFEAESAATEII